MRYPEVKLCITHLVAVAKEISRIEIPELQKSIIKLSEEENLPQEKVEELRNFLRLALQFTSLHTFSNQFLFHPKVPK